MFNPREIIAIRISYISRTFTRLNNSAHCLGLLHYIHYPSSICSLNISATWHNTIKCTIHMLYKVYMYTSLLYSIYSTVRSVFNRNNHIRPWPSIRLFFTCTLYFNFKLQMHACNILFVRICNILYSFYVAG